MLVLKVAALVVGADVEPAAVPPLQFVPVLQLPFDVADHVALTAWAEILLANNMLTTSAFRILLNTAETLSELLEGMLLIMVTSEFKGYEGDYRFKLCACHQCLTRPVA